ncbi:DUF6545 domain-containing protein [Actinosynnema sp. ALI-1.44]|uniref:DUF6545 domain-containing protein n=1 Tax=Actinosynnema sp. ALI-1.44 TaxID=1933779 RepID=UPI00268D1B6F
MARGKRLCPHHRVRRQLLELSEWRWALAPRFDPDVRSAAERTARVRGLSGTDLDSAVEAAQLKAAVNHSRRAAGTAYPEATQDGSGLDSECAWWVAVAQAFRGSPVVNAAITEARVHRVRGVLFTSPGRQGPGAALEPRGTSGISRFPAEHRACRRPR